MLNSRGVFGWRRSPVLPVCGSRSMCPLRCFPGLSSFFPLWCLHSGVRFTAVVDEVPWVLFLGLCLDFHYSLTGVVFPKFGFDFSRRAVAQALVEP